jgi:hypothetical protein
VTPITAGVGLPAYVAIMNWMAERMEAAMFTYPSPTSRVTISARVAEWRRHTQSPFELTPDSDRRFNDVPFGPTEARVAADKLFLKP